MIYRILILAVFLCSSISASGQDSLNQPHIETLISHVVYPQVSESRYDLKEYNGNYGLDNPNEHLEEVNKVLEEHHIDLKAVSCSKMLLIAVPSREGNESYGARCTTESLRDGKKSESYLCYDKMVGRFMIRKIGYATDDNEEIKSLILNYCYGG